MTATFRRPPALHLCLCSLARKVLQDAGLLTYQCPPTAYPANTRSWSVPVAAVSRARAAVEAATAAGALQAAGRAEAAFVLKAKAQLASDASLSESESDRSPVGGQRQQRQQRQLQQPAPQQQGQAVRLPFLRRSLRAADVKHVLWAANGSSFVAAQPQAQEPSAPAPAPQPGPQTAGQASTVQRWPLPFSSALLSTLSAVR